MAEQLLELLFREMVLVEQFVDDLVEQRRLFAGGLAHALGIKHHHDGEGRSQGKDGGVESFGQAQRGGHGGGHGGMGARHAAGAA